MSRRRRRAGGPVRWSSRVEKSPLLENRDQPTNDSDGSRLTVRVVMALATLYVLWMIVVPPIWVDPGFRALWRWPQLAVHRFVGQVYAWLGVDSPSLHFQAAGFYVVSAFLIPLGVVVLLFRARWSDLGWRRPNRLLIRIVACSLVFSIPFLYWMVHSPGFLDFYEPYFQAGLGKVALYYLVVLFCEHSLMEGTLLGIFRRGHRWPVSATVVCDAKPGARRALQWLGLAQPTRGATGLLRFTRWIGLPDGCVGAMILSGAVFGMVHWGKDAREFLLSFPGGVFLAFLAYRCNSWHAPYLLHASTVLAAGLIMVAMR